MKQTQTNSNNLKQIQTNSNKLKQTQTNSNKLKQTQTNSNTRGTTSQHQLRRRRRGYRISNGYGTRSSYRAETKSLSLCKFEVVAQLIWLKQKNGGRRVGCIIIYPRHHGSIFGFSKTAIRLKLCISKRRKLNNNNNGN